MNIFARMLFDLPFQFCRRPAYKWDRRLAKAQIFKSCEECRHFRKGQNVTLDICLRSGTSCNGTRGNPTKCGMRGDWWTP